MRFLLSVPGGRLALFLFLLFSAVFSRGGHSVTSCPLEPLNWSGSLLVAGSKGRALSPGRRKHTQKKPHYSPYQTGKHCETWIGESNMRFQRYCAFHVQTLWASFRHCHWRPHVHFYFNDTNDGGTVQAMKQWTGFNTVKFKSEKYDSVWIL